MNKFCFVLFFCKIGLCANVKIDPPLKFKNLEQNSINECVQKNDSGSVWTSYRLPRSLIPVHYSLKIRPIIDDNYLGLGDVNTAPSSVSIQVQCMKPTRQIIMHQKLLYINETSVQVKNLQSSQVISVCSIDYDRVRDFLIINLMSDLEPPTHYEISVVYIAMVEESDQFGGLYSERYFDPLSNQTKVLVTTQLQPLGARQMLPCFDEPSYKTSFKVIIGRTGRFSSLSNSLLIGTQPDSENLGWFWDSFNVTVPMPTYLLAVGISEYSFYESSIGLYRLPIRVYGPRHLIDEEKGILSANITAILMNYFEQKYLIPYKMPKLDSISVPKKRGAMENYGLITYGEEFIMLDEENSNYATVRRAYHIVAHELSHNWFGNLLTCSWWSDLWLNEGFATYISYQAVQVMWPRFNMDTFMINDMTNIALKVDASAASHPVHRASENAKHIRYNFDDIIYKKGGSLVNMMSSFLGDAVFDQGIKYYLNDFQENVVTQENLFEALENAALAKGLALPKKLEKIMRSWTFQSGFPLVRVKYLEEKNCLIFTQEPWGKSCDGNSTKNVSWDIPVQYMVKLSDQSYYQKRSFWLLKGEVYLKGETFHSKVDWILTNPDSSGYYRTQYDLNLTRRIQEQLRMDHTLFPVAARVRLMDDQLTLGFEGYMPLQRSLEFLNYLGNETDPSVWLTVLANLEKLRWCFAQDSNETTYDIFKMYLLPRVNHARENIERILENKGCTESNAYSHLYSELVDWSCELNSVWCIDYTTQLFEEWLRTPHINPVPLNVQTTIYCKMVDVMGQPAYLWMQEQYKMAGYSTSVKSSIASAIGCVTDNFENTTQMAIARKATTPMNSILILKNILRHTTEGRNFLLVKLTDVSKWIDNYGWTARELVQLLHSGIENFSAHEDQNHLEKILLKNYAIFGSRSSGIIDITKQNVEWCMENRNNVIIWMNSKI